MPVKKLGYLVPSKTLLLLCDVQEKFRFMNFFVDTMKNINKLLLAGKTLGIPLIVTEQNPDRLGNTVAEFDTKHAVGNYAKTKFSMVIPEVVEFLEKSNGLETIVLMGLETHICVEQTAMDLLSLERFIVHVAADCVLSRTSEDRILALNRLEKMGCIITSSENVLFKLIKDKNHPKFNDIRKLVAEPSVFPGLTNKM